MAYFKIGNKDYSNIVNSLKVKNAKNFNSQTNANGDMVVDLINAKKEIEVGIIPLDEDKVFSLLNDIEAFQVSISFRNPRTKQLQENLECICPSNEVDYYTIQVGNVKLNGFTLNFIEL